MGLMQQIERDRDQLVEDFSMKLDGHVRKYMDAFMESYPGLKDKINEAHLKGMCPSCGFNLTGDTEMISAGVVWEPSGMLWINNKRIHVTPSQHATLGCIMRRRGLPASKDIIMSRAGSDATHTKIVDVWVCKIKKMLKNTTGRSDLILNVRGEGWLWKDYVERKRQINSDESDQE